MLSALLRTARLFKTPRLAAEWSAEFIEDRIITPRRRKHTSYYNERQLPLTEAVAQVTGRHQSEIERHLNNLPDFLVTKDKDPGMTIKWSATSELAATTYIIVRLLKPVFVVETGVGAGVSSWTILKAMDENKSGTLISIDLPTPNTELLPEVGYLVPRELRKRWKLRTGPSQRLLPKVLEELGQIDIFQHDSRHSYSNHIREYRTAWPHIRSGGMLISDDVSNDALHDVSRQWNQEPSIVEQSKQSPIGLLRKA